MGKLVKKKCIVWVCPMCGVVERTEVGNIPSIDKIQTESGHYHKWIPVQVETEVFKQ